MLTKQGPKVGRNPSSPPAEIWDMLMKVVPMKSSFPILSLSFTRNLILSHMEGNWREGEGGERGRYIGDDYTRILRVHVHSRRRN